MTEANTPQTPCVGLCSTVYGDLVCRGCKRFHLEVVNWNRYTEPERAAVWQRLEMLLAQVLRDKLDIRDAGLLRQRLQAHQVAYGAAQSLEYQAYRLLLKGGPRIRDWSAYGLALRPAYAHLDAQALRALIEREFFELSEAHYQRYIAPPFE